MALAVRDQPAEELSARELTLRCVASWHRVRPDEHARLRTALERKLERGPRTRRPGPASRVSTPRSTSSG